MVEEEQATSPKPLTDQLALRRVRKHVRAYGKELAEKESRPFDKMAQDRARLPSDGRLENILAEARALRRTAD